MKKIHVALGAHAYDIEIAAGLLPQVGSKVAALLPKARKAAIIRANRYVVSCRLPHRLCLASRE